MNNFVQDLPSTLDDDNTIHVNIKRNLTLRTPYIVVKIRKSADVTCETNKLHTFLLTCVYY